MIEDATYSTLQIIEDKVRNVTGSPSEYQLSSADIKKHINTFILYDFPQLLRLFDCKTTLTFFTEPYIDEYSTNTTDPNDPLYNFNNRYISVHPPVYCAGYNVFLSESRQQFFGVYPLTNSIGATNQTGDGSIVDFAGTLSAKPVLRNNVLFSSVDTDNGGLAVYDDGEGNLHGDCTTPGTIDYVTGAYAFRFTRPPAVGVAVNSQTIPYSPSMPQGICYYDNKFVVRPVPDQPYRINIEVYRRPTELLSTNDMPEISQWWQLIAYGAIIKVFQDRQDTDGENKALPEFERQKSMVVSKTYMQYSNQRTATIFTEQTASTGSGFGWNGGNTL